MHTHGECKNIWSLVLPDPFAQTHDLSHLRRADAVYITESCSVL